MITAVADTHALVWAFLGDPRLSARAQAAFATGEVGISSITFAEVLYLEEKRRLQPGITEALHALVSDSGTLLTEIPVNAVIAKAMARISRSSVPDLPDRIIAATALHLGVPLITRDRKIQASGIDSVW